jgi:hypothetical protein
MSDDREALVSEIQRLLKVSRRWRAIAIAGLILVFVVLIPFTMGFWWLVGKRENMQVRRALQHIVELEQQLQKKTATPVAPKGRAQ